MHPNGEMRQVEAEKGGGGGRGEERGKALQYGAGRLPQSDDSDRLMRHGCVCNV